MTAFIVLLVFLLLIGPLAVLYGADSRFAGDRGRRRPWPRARRARSDR